MPTTSKQAAEVRYSTDGPVPVVELRVPKGTRVIDLGKIQQFISKSIISKIAPRGCTACISGTHFIIREEFENVVRVDLATGRIT
jgi:hypothetical protein